jgi:hypothetical protein
MRRWVVLALAGVLTALCVGATSAATEPRGTVVIGQITCFRIRVPDRGLTVQQRVDYIQDMAPKFLGGDPVQVTIRPVGEEQHIDVNGEFVVSVTPGDARATGYKNAAALAPIWRGALEHALLMSSARPEPPPSLPTR